MRITWVTRSFLDYRIPVFSALDELCGHQLTVIYNREVISEALETKIKNILRERAIGLIGEWRLATTRKKNITTGFANKGIRIPFQPGLLKALHASTPDVTISDGFMQWTYATLWQRMSHGIPHVMCYERTAYTERNCQWYRRFYRKIAMKFIDGYCVNGKLCGEYLQTLGALPEEISFGQMAADTKGLADATAQISISEIAALRDSLGIEGRMFLYVGQLIARKGVQQLLEAWEEAKLTDATLVLIGEGSERDALQAYANDYGLNVIFVGRVNYDAIAPYYKSADVFVMPTMEDNWSLVVPEAMACGLPIACSQYNGCYPELVTSANGWIFDPMNCQETAEMLRTIAEMDKSTLVSMGEASRSIVEEFTPQKAAERIFKSCCYAVEARKR